MEIISNSYTYDYVDNNRKGINISISSFASGILREITNINSIKLEINVTTGSLI